MLTGGFFKGSLGFLELRGGVELHRMVISHTAADIKHTVLQSSNPLPESHTPLGFNSHFISAADGRRAEDGAGEDKVEKHFDGYTLLSHCRPQECDSSSH